ncbi:MAG: hypothetical protein EZS28_047299 [Streblomastix strix]|uniref:Uncharacterized protein n=1 Tax=Streblomastix strix TaxID=222440 RepID=A0A5J4TFE1_9EUKA|nr:MAG: hypothetical protein EZS28_047299 [Streblomastix strix]
MYQAERLKHNVKTQKTKVQQDPQRIKNPFRSKAKDKSEIVQDIKLKPLKKYQRPYFSPELGSWCRSVRCCHTETTSSVDKFDSPFSQCWQTLRSIRTHQKYGFLISQL